MPEKEITLSPFYHSAVNAVTEPGKTVFVSQYFADRWAPLLGGNGVLIVMALRRLGYLNRKTGERRDEIVVGCEELAKRAGISEDTLARELGVNRKTGKPKNEWIGLFVQPRKRSRRDKLGRVWQEENGYWIAMDDPIHPDDWPLVEGAIQEAEARLEKRNGPDPQIAGPAVARRPQSAESGPQNAVPDPQSAGSSPQNAAALRNPDSPIPKNTSLTPAAPGDSLPLFPEGERPKPWEHLTEPERRPYEDQAEQELAALFGLSRWNECRTKKRHREARARNLYMAANPVA